MLTFVRAAGRQMRACAKQRPHAPRPGSEDSICLDTGVVFQRYEYMRHFAAPSPQRRLESRTSARDVRARHAARDYARVL